MWWAMMAQAIDQGVSAWSDAIATKKQAEQEAEMFNYQSNVRNKMAKTNLEIGEVRASRIRQQGKHDADAIGAAYAGNGVEVDSASAAAVEGEFFKRNELDAIAQILEGKRRAYDLEQQANQFATAARNTVLSAKRSILASVVRGKSNNYYQWGSAGKAGSSSSSSSQGGWTDAGSDASGMGGDGGGMMGSYA